jgi:hypothetical protein
MKNENLEFTTTLKSVPVKIDGKDYTLTELTGKERDAYNTESAKRLKMELDAKGRATPIVRNFDGYQTELITMALVDAAGNHVPEDIIAGWPASVQAALFRKARELSGLSLTEDEQARIEAATKNV